MRAAEEVLGADVAEVEGTFACTVAGTPFAVTLFAVVVGAAVVAVVFGAVGVVPSFFASACFFFQASRRSWRWRSFSSSELGAGDCQVSLCIFKVVGGA